MRPVRRLLSTLAESLDDELAVQGKHHELAFELVVHHELAFELAVQVLSCILVLHSCLAFLSCIDIKTLYMICMTIVLYSLKLSEYDAVLGSGA